MDIHELDLQTSPQQLLKVTHRLIPRRAEVETVIRLFESSSIVYLTPSQPNLFGTGKSTLAYLVVRALLEQGQCTSALWVECGPTVRTLDSFRDLQAGLLILDDLWFIPSSEDLSILPEGAWVLITTELLPRSQTAYAVGALRVDESAALASDILGTTEYASQIGELASIFNYNALSTVVLGNYLKTLGGGQAALDAARRGLTYLARMPNPFAEISGPSAYRYSCELTSVASALDPAIRWTNTRLGGKIVSNTDWWFSSVFDSYHSIPSRMGLFELVGGDEPHPVQPVTTGFDEPLPNAPIRLPSVDLFRDALAWAAAESPLHILSILMSASQFLVRQAVQGDLKEHTLQWNQILIDLAVASKNYSVQQMGYRMLALADGQNNQFDRKWLAHIEAISAEFGLEAQIAAADVFQATADLNSGNHEAAYNGYTKALEHTDSRNPMRAELLWLVGCLEASFGLPDAKSHFDAALIAFMDFSNDIGIFKTRLILGKLAIHNGEFLNALYQYEQGLTACDAWLASLPFNTATIQETGQRLLHEPAFRALNDMLPFIDQTNVQFYVLLQKAETLKHVGDLVHHTDPARAEASYQSALAIYQELGSVLGAANTHKALGDLYQTDQLLDLDAAMSAYQEALNSYRQLASDIGIAITLLAMAKLVPDAGELQSLLDECLVRSRQTGVEPIIREIEAFARDMSVR